jgi:polar amino acid transport system substrate-binding protein
MALAALLATLATGCADDDQGGPRSAGEFTPAHDGVLTVATRPIPTAGFWEGTSGNPTGGFEYGLVLELAERFGLGRVDVIEKPFVELVAGDLAGADVALAQISPTPERESRLDFSTAYLEADAGMLVRAGTEIPDLASARELHWAVQRTTTNEAFLHDRVRPKHAPRVTESRVEALDLLEAGEVDAVMLDTPVALVLAERSAGRLAVPAQIETGGVEAVALPDGSHNKAAVDSAVRAFLADGTIDHLAKTWLGTGATGTTAHVPILRTAGP